MDAIQSVERIFCSMQCLHKFSMIRDLNDLSQGEMAVMDYLAFRHDGATAGELSEAFGVSTSRTAAVLNTLEKKGYALRKADEHDGRKVLVYITDIGRNEANAKRELALEHMREFMGLLGEADAREFVRIVRKAAIEHARRHRKGQRDI